jgi:antitoxin component of RelBE/YafQ-DinJ toxin-antitoxin module
MTVSVDDETRSLWTRLAARLNLPRSTYLNVLMRQEAERLGLPPEEPPKKPARKRKATPAK